MENTVFQVTTAVSGIALVVALLSAFSIYNDLNEFHAVVNSDFKEFQTFSDNAWDMLVNTAMNHGKASETVEIFRAKRYDAYFPSSYRESSGPQRARAMDAMSVDYAPMRQFVPNPFQNQRARQPQCNCGRQPTTCPPGPPGPPGPDGHPGPHGDDGPHAPHGNHGSCFSDSNLGCIPCPAGPPGQVGIRGTPGPMGPSGRPGNRGQPGKNGYPGTMGTFGDRGQNGSPGYPGTPGSPGHDGVRRSCRITHDNERPSCDQRGPPGPSGNSGRPGPSGMPGFDGRPGAPGLLGAPGRSGPPGMPGRNGTPGNPGIPGIDAGYCKCPIRSPAEDINTPTFGFPPHQGYGRRVVKRRRLVHANVNVN